MVVHDITGARVDHLSGELTKSTYEEIIERTDPNITKFEGADNLRCLACGLGARVELLDKINKENETENGITK